MTNFSPSYRSMDSLIIRTMQNSLSVKSHFQLLLWMQGDFQEVIPHETLVSLSGTIQSNTYYYDIVSPTPNIRSLKIPHRRISAFRNSVHQHWSGCGGRVTSISIGDDSDNPLDAAAFHESLRDMKHMLIHAIPDTRFKADHLYVLLRQEAAFNSSERKLFELMLPHIDAAVRKIDGLPVIEPEQETAPILINTLIKSGLTTREIEILEWVRNGKTNIEIGMILEISTFTVKNHLQRIFRKINASNRAQAVAKIEEIVNQNKRGTTPSPTRPAATALLG